MSFGMIVLITVLVLVSAGMLAARGKQRDLKAAPSGSVRVESVKAQRINGVVRQYATAGWVVTGQSTAKSLGSQARVTITFEKA